MRTKIARNEEKTAKIRKYENVLDDKIKNLLNNTKKYNHIKLRVKENKPNRHRPKAPHNTTQYLSQIYEDNKTLDENFMMTQINLNHENNYSIDNFIITGGSLKGILFIFHYNIFNFILIYRFLQKCVQ